MAEALPHPYLTPGVVRPYIEGMEPTTNMERKLTMADHFAAAAPNGYPNWNPTAHPYRVAFHYHGTHTANLSTTAVFATELEARTAFAATMPKRAFRATLDVAENADAWIDRGRWGRIAARKRGVPA